MFNPVVQPAQPPPSAERLGASLSPAEQRTWQQLAAAATTGGCLAGEEPAGYAPGEANEPAWGVSGTAGEPEPPEPGGRMALAAERLATTPDSPLAQALTQLHAATARLAEVDWSEEHVEVIGDALLTLQAARSSADLALLDGVEAFDARDGYRRDGSASSATWLANRTNLAFGQASDLAIAARRLHALPLFRERLAAGDLGLAHLVTVTRRCTGPQAEAIIALQHDLVETALAHRSLHALRHELRLLLDQYGRDGTDPADHHDDPGHAAGAHPDRSLHHSASFEGMGLLDARLDPLARELLANALNAFDEPDPPDTPFELRRTAAQRRHDALVKIVTTALSAPGRTGVQGVRAHALIVVDLFDLLGLDPADPTARTAITTLLDALDIHIPALDDILDRLTEPAPQTDGPTPATRATRATATRRATATQTEPG